MGFAGSTVAFHFVDDEGRTEKVTAWASATGNEPDSSPDERREKLVGDDAEVLVRGLVRVTHHVRVVILDEVTHGSESDSTPQVVEKPRYMVIPSVWNSAYSRASHGHTAL